MSEKKMLKFPDINNLKYNFKDFEGCYTQEDELNSYKMYIRDVTQFKEGLIAEITDLSSNAKLASMQDIIPEIVKEHFKGQRKAYLTVLGLLCSEEQKT